VNGILDSSEAVTNARRRIDDRSSWPTPRTARTRAKYSNPHLPRLASTTRHHLEARLALKRSLASRNRFARGGASGSKRPSRRATESTARPRSSKGRSRSRNTPAMMAIATNPISPATAARSRRGAIGGPNSSAGTAKMGSEKSTAKFRRVATPRPVATWLFGIPASLSNPYCTAVAVAAPPGTMRATADEASCDMAISVHSFDSRQSPSSTQKQMRLSRIITDIATSEPGRSRSSSGHELKTSTTLGMTR
jgi:hypothetical protein